MPFPLLAPVLALLLTVVPAAPPSGSPCLLPPVTAPIIDPFRPPLCPWCPGNRGLEYEVAAGTPVRAAAAGVVTFSGSVAGVIYVVVGHADGTRTTYGRLAAATVGGGDTVASGTVVGRSGGGLFFGLRNGETYLDPAPRLGRLVERPRLVPTDGTAPRPGPPPVLRCGVAGGDEQARWSPPRPR